jgi:hypothetical protein
VIHCGDFCGDSKSILRQADAFRHIEPQWAKSRKSRGVEGKSLKMEYVASDAKNLLLISGLQVRVLPGSPLFFDPSGHIIHKPFHLILIGWPLPAWNP